MATTQVSGGGSEARPAGNSRGRRWPKRLGVAVVLLVAAVPLTSWVWAAWEERGLVRRVEALRKAGEPVTPADLGGPPVPEARNAAAAFRAAARTIDAESPAWATFEHYDNPGLPLWPKERAALEAALAENGEALARAGRAAGMGEADWAIVMASPMIEVLLPDLNEQRRLARLLQADALLALEAGDLLRALHRADEMLALTRALGRHPTLVAHLVSVGLTAFSASLVAEVAREIAAGGRLPGDVRAQADALVARLLNEREFHDGLARAYRHERVMQLDAITSIVDGQYKQKGSPANAGAPRLGGAPRGWFLRNASGSLDHMAGMIAAAEATADWPAFRARLAASPSAIERSPRLYSMGNLLSAALERTAESHYRATGNRRMAAAALAVALHASEHEGRFPKTLGELVPAYLPAVPGDPLAGGGKPLGYVPDPARPRVYGVGENGVDDGGRPPDPAASNADNRRLSDEVFDLKRQPRPEPEDPAAEPPPMPEFLDGEGDGGNAE